MHLNSLLLFKKYATKHFKPGQKIMEIGPCGYPSMYHKQVNIEEIDWHTLDIGDAHIESGEKYPGHIITPDGYNYPIEDNTYDIVLSGQVMEHVPKIWTWIEELKRITKPGGKIIIIIPISWRYHEAPVDCWRIYPEGMKALMDSKELTIVECKFESLEMDLLNKKAFTTPGYSVMSLDGKVPNSAKVLQFLHQVPLLNRLIKPINVSYDNICVVKK